MRLTHYRHACVLVEIAAQRILIDPGTYSDGFTELRDVDSILVTHAHPDHLDLDRVGVLLQHNPQATVVLSASASRAVAELTTPVAVEPGDKFTSGELDIVVTGSGNHAPVHPDLSRMDNNGYALGSALLHPGDAFEPAGTPVDVLLIPVGGPWMKFGDSVDYLREVAPRIAVPIHQAGLAPAHQQMHHQLLAKLAPAGTEVVLLDHGTPTEL
jgi:L-ascorbate metabolism protein UlaG (beta-lactamase superfamily)